MDVTRARSAPLLATAGLALGAALTASASSPPVPGARDGARIERQLQAHLEQMLPLARAVEADLETGAPAAPSVAALLSLFDQVRASDLLIMERQKGIEARLQARGVSAAVLTRRAEAAAAHRQEMDRLDALTDAIVRLASEPSERARLAEASARLARYLEQKVLPRDRTPLGVSLPYRPLNLPQVAPQLGDAIVPAYLDRTLPPPSAADLSEGPEALLSAEIREQARALKYNPIAVFEFVQNEIETDFYHGAMKGAAETLRQKRGNDTDQASLLIALLRASAVPARYVRGVISLSGAQAVAWTGVASTPRAAELLTRAGIPFRPVSQGGTIGAFQVEHTWVEAYVPYTNYRGEPLDTGGRSWVPLDPSLKSVVFDPGTDLLAAMSFTADSLVAGYLASPQPVSPVDFYKKKITDYLAQNHPDLSFEQAIGRLTLQPVSSGLLPSTLPYPIVSVNQEGALLPEPLRHRVRFIVQGDGGPAFDITVPASDLLGRRLTLSYVPATVEDQIAANAFLGLDNTPAYLVKVRPVLKAGGVVRGAGETPIQMGATHDFTIEIQTPRGAYPISNVLVAGGYYAIGLGGSRVQYQLPQVPAPEDTERRAADLLYQQAVDYLERWNQAERAIADILRVVNVRPVLSEVMVGGVYNRTMLFGQPQEIDWRGVFVDADWRTSEPIPVGPEDERRREFLRLAGLAGSMLESEVLEQNLGVDAVSAAKLLQVARAGGIPIEEIDATNVDTLLPLLQTAQVVKTDVADAVRQGWRATIPHSDLTRNIWSGIGYILLDPATGAGGYFISGGLAGGMSSEDPHDWVQQQYVDVFGSPYQDPPNTDPTAAAAIHKVAITDRQEGTVGEPLARPLAVWVIDREGRPVQGAAVTFIVQVGGGHFGNRPEVIAKTDYLGVAEASPNLTLGTKTSDAPTYLCTDRPCTRASGKHVTQVGQNIVTAKVGTAGGEILLESPFEAVALPGDPHHIIKVQGDNSTAGAGTLGGTLVARIEDLHGNPISNVGIEFTVLPAVAKSGTLPGLFRNLKIHPHEPPCQNFDGSLNLNPILGQCGGVDRITVTTDTLGAAVEAILGDTVATTFQVSAAVPQGTQVAPQTFTLHSTGERTFGTTEYRPPQLLMARPELVTGPDRPVGAKAGTLFPHPLEVVLYMLEDHYILEAVDPPTGKPCAPPNPPCFKIVSFESGRIRPIDNGLGGPPVSFGGKAADPPIHVPKENETASVEFVPEQGGGATTASVNPDAGRHRAALTLGPAPALNVVRTAATATVWVPCFDLYQGTVTPRLLTLTSEQNHANFTSCSASPPLAAGQPFTLKHQLFGIRATAAEKTVAVTASGATTADEDLEYVIEPPAYQAQLADVDLFAVESDGPSETWITFLTGRDLSGSGKARLFRGSRFDLSKTHKMQLVLNRGTKLLEAELEVKSEKANLLLAPDALLTAQGTKVTTYLDRINQDLCSAGGTLALALSRDARVTITVDGNVLTAADGVTYKDVPLPGGITNPLTRQLVVHPVPITPLQVPGPGEHDLQVTAVFQTPGLPDVTRTAAGKVLHEVVINAFLPVGHTLIKGVDLQDGHLSLSRDDLSIPGHGPSLEFTRSYGSSGHQASGPMGAGWRHNYESRVVQVPCGAEPRPEPPDSRITLVGGEGSGIRFSQPTSGTDAQGNLVQRYKPQAGYHGQLILNVGDGSYDFFTKHRTRYHYEKAFSPIDVVVHRLAFVEDTHGNRLTLTYDNQPPFSLKTVTDPSGRTLRFTYQSSGLVPEDRIVKVEGPLGLEVRFEYDAFGNLIKAARDVRVERYEYSVGDPRDRHNLVKVLGPNHGVTGPQSDVTRFTYYTDQDPFPGESTDLLAFPEKYEFVKTVTEGFGAAEAAEHRFRYDYSSLATKLVTTVVDPRQVSTVYTLHPQFGAVVESRVALDSGDHVTRTRWAFEDGIDDVLITRLTDPNGRVTTYSYDPSGNPTREVVDVETVPYAAVKSAEGAEVAQVVTAYEYDATFNKVTRKIDSEGNVTLYGIDPVTAELLSATTDPKDGSGPIVTRYTYGTSGALKGLLKKVTDPRGQVTTYESYDAFGNSTKVIDPAGNVTTNVYDGRSRLLESHDTIGHRAAYVYDELDRAASVTKAAGNQPLDLTMPSADRSTTTEFFPGGQARSVIDGLGHQTDYQYDALNRLVLQRDEVQDADATTAVLEIAIAYDGNGNKVLETDRRRIPHSYSYDALNRLTETRVQGQTVATYTYDAAGNRLGETDLHGHVSILEYDGLYRPVRTILPLTPFTLSTDYDRVGNVVRRTDANGKATTFTYDGVYRLTSETSAVGVTTRYRYDAAGNRVRVENLTTGLVTRYEGFDGLNRPTAIHQEFTDPLAGQAVSYTVTQAYDDPAHVKVITNARGFVVQERYNGHDQLIEKTVDPGGLKLRTAYKYDGNGNLTGLKDSEGSELDAAYEYDGLNRKTVAKYPLGGLEKFFYDGNGNLVRSIDRRGIERRYEYDHLDRRTRDILTESLSANGSELVIAATAYEDVANATVTTDANGNATRQESDALHRPVRLVDPLGQVFRTEWDGVNKLGEVDRRGIRTGFRYDAVNRLLEQRRIGENATTVQTVAYLDSQNRVVETDPRGVETIMQLDPLQRTRRTSRRHAGLAAPYGAAEILAEEREYDGHGNVTRITDAGGNVTRFVYDGADRQISLIEGADSPVEAITAQTWDKAGNLLTVKDGRAHDGRFDVRMTYDQRNRKVLEENGAGEVTSYAYDQNDNLVSVTEPKRGVHVTSYAYDELGRLTAADETRGGAGGVTRYLYDANRNRIAQQDANGNLTTYRYDALNRLTDSVQHVVPDALAAGRTRDEGAGGDEATARRWRSAYDPNGNETLIVDAEGQRVAKTYDYLDRLVRKDYSDHKPAVDGSLVFPRLLTIANEYDANGNPVRVDETKQFDADTTAVETCVMEYDPLNRPVTRTNYDGKTVRFAYDRQGNQTAVTDADGARTGYTFDARNRMATAEEGASSAATHYTYWPDGLTRTITYPNGVVTEAAYDAADRVREVLNHRGDQSNPLSQFDYTYDPNGNRATQSERHARLNAGVAQQTAYRYDALNRLVEADYPGAPAVTYTYAPNGNRLSETGVAPASGATINRHYTYDRLNQLGIVTDAADPAASMVFRYDRNGNTVQQKMGALDAAGGDVPSPTMAKSYAFDIRDNLARAERTGGDRVRFDYDYAGRRVKMITPDKQIRYLHDQADVVQEYDAASLATTLRYSYGPGGLSALTTVTGDFRNRFFYVLDGLGSTSELTDEAGDTQASYAYDAWGRVFQSVDLTPNRRRFTGHYADSETGLQYFGARYYDDSLGRFLSQDPYLGDVNTPASLHRYLYAYANPVRFVDLTGYEATEATGEPDVIYERQEDGVPSFTNVGFVDVAGPSPCADKEGPCFVWNNEAFASVHEKRLEENAIEQRARIAGAEATKGIDAVLASTEYKLWRMKWGRREQEKLDLATLVDPTEGQGYGWAGQLARDWERIGRKVEHRLNQWEIENPSWLKSKAVAALQTGMDMWVESTSVLKFSEGLAEGLETGSAAPVLTDVLRGVSIVSTVAPALGTAGRGATGLAHAAGRSRRLAAISARNQAARQAATLRTTNGVVYVGDPSLEKTAKALASRRGAAVEDFLNPAQGPENDFMDVVIHGATLESVGAENVADVLTMRGVRARAYNLLACSGACDVAGGLPLAQRWANATGRPTLGYTGTVRVIKRSSENGRLLTGSTLVETSPGKWEPAGRPGTTKIFYPK